jgi:hypothetical protein
MALAGLASLRRQKGAEYQQLAASGVNAKSVRIYGAKGTGGVIGANGDPRKAGFAPSYPPSFMLWCLSSLL